MIDAILEWSLRQRLVVLALGLCVIGWGGWEATRMPVDVFPDLTAPSVTIVAEAHGMSPSDMEQTVTFPIESAVNGATGVRRVRSNTAEGIAVIYVDFEWGVDLLEARQIVAERMQTVRNELPPEAEAPLMGPMTSVMGDIVFLGLTTSDPEAVSQMELRTIADWTIARRLLAIPGVAQVIPLGGDVRQYQVVLNPQRLDAYDVTAEEVADALAAANENVPAGFLVEGRVEHLITGKGRVENLEDIEETFVAERDGVPVQVSDVGRVQMGPAIKRGSGGVSGEEGVILGVRKQPDVNSLALTDEIDGVLDELEPGLPDELVLHRALFRQADFIEVAVDNVTEALRDGSLLVILIVLLFLGSGRATFITALAIPLSLLTAVLVMSWQGLSINTMTLGGMAIAVGALVDDAIIDVENVTRRLRQWFSLPEAERPTLFEVVYDGSREIRQSIVFATGIIVLVFLPLFFLSGVEGQILRPLGYAYVISLAASLVVALTVTPVLCYLLLPGSKAVTGAEETRVVRTLKGWYEPVVRSAIGRWKVLTMISAVLLVGAVIGALFAGRAFLPSFNEGAFNISVSTPPGTALAESVATAKRVEKIILRQPGVLSTARRTGRGSGDEHAQPVFASELEVRLDRDADVDKDDFLRKLRADLDQIPGVGIVIGQPLEHRIEHLISGSRSAIAVKIFGQNLNEMQRVGKAIEAQLNEVPGTADVFLEQKTMVPYVSVSFNRRALARYGMNVHQVSDEIATAFNGHVATTVYEGSATYDLVVLYDRTELEAIEDVRSARIGTPSGARVPLSTLASIERSVGPNSIGRENVRRKLVVMSNVADRDVGSVVADIQQRIRANVEIPKGTYVEIGGQFESAEAAARVIAIVGFFVLIGIFVLLVVALRDPRDALLVMVNLPLALIGGVVGVFVAGGTISIASLIGFIALFGIAARNGIMMVTHIQHLHAVEGEDDRREAAVRGALERLAPITMTALASGLGLLPLALALGEPGSEIQAPMAIVILFGLLSSTALNMLVVPALYLRFGAYPTDIEQHFGAG